MGGQVERRGLLISLEGLDGVGKTTQIERLHVWLQERVQEVLCLREPGGTEFGEMLRQLILHGAEVSSGLAEFLVFAAARAELMETVVLPALSRGAVVLMDRFIDSSVAYQAFGHGLDPDVVMEINRLVIKGCTPDLTCWLRGEPYALDSGDRMEVRGADYFRRVEQGYAWLSEQEPERWLVINSRQNPDIIFDTVTTRINLLLDKSLGGKNR